jgi:hypothetical protein
MGFAKPLNPSYNRTSNIRPPSMPRMPTSELTAMLTAEKLDALAAMRASKLSAERAHAMDYYNGDMSHDMPAQEGRSRAVSTDVADTIDGLMPSLMEIFAGSDDVVRFEPFGPEDVTAAEQETDYVNHVFMQQNPGFLVLYSFIKDALLSKVGIVKVWWEEREEESRETYLDQPDDAFALLVADPDIEIVAHSERPDPAFRPASISPQLPASGAVAQPDPATANAPLGAAALGAPALGAPALAAPAPPAPAPVEAAEPDDAPVPMLHDVTVVTRRTVAQARVQGVPPEEFGISRFARSLRDCGYCFHEVIRREEDLIADGYDRDEIKAIPSYTMPGNPEELARDTVDEHLAAGGDEGINEVNRQIKITEHYVRMDYEGNNKPALYRVTTGGEEGAVLTRHGEPEIVPVDAPPFAAMTPVIVTHRFFGRSIADLVMDIQRIKTALLRSILDNAYLAVNPRVEVSEAHATETTLDDLLVSRPGGIVRTKMPGGVNWQTVPAIAGEIFPVLAYADSTREGRTGVNRQAQGLDANALQNTSATAAMQVYNAAQARMKLIARIFAETGIRDLFGLLHATLRKHGSRAATVRLRNQWVTVDPRDWRKRDDLTINVGLGTGGKSERLAHVMAVINLQKEALTGGLSNLVTVQNLYNSAAEVVKLVDLKNVDQFFTDPKTQAPPQPRPDPKLLQIQTQAQLDAAQAQSQLTMLDHKAQRDSALAQQRFELDRQLALLQHELAMRDQQFRHVQAAVGAAGGADAPGAGALVAQLMDTIRQMNAPKRVVRDAHGRVSHVEPMPLSPMMPMPPPVSPMVPPAGVTPPVPGAQLPLGARLAPDGHHYLADPSRPGKYLRVVANG